MMEEEVVCSAKSPHSSCPPLPPPPPLTEPSASDVSIKTPAMSLPAHLAMESSPFKHSVTQSCSSSSSSSAGSSSYNNRKGRTLSFMTPVMSTPPSSPLPCLSLSPPPSSPSFSFDEDYLLPSSSLSSDTSTTPLSPAYLSQSLTDQQTEENPLSKYLPPPPTDQKTEENPLSKYLPPPVVEGSHSLQDHSSSYSIGSSLCLSTSNSSRQTDHAPELELQFSDIFYQPFSSQPITYTPARVTMTPTKVTVPPVPKKRTVFFEDSSNPDPQPHLKQTSKPDSKSLTPPVPKKRTVFFKDSTNPYPQSHFEQTSKPDSKSLTPPVPKPRSGVVAPKSAVGDKTIASTTSELADGGPPPPPPHPSPTAVTTELTASDSFLSC